MKDKIILLESLVYKALDMVYENDMHLILNRPLYQKKSDDEHHVGERSIVFRFAHYLQNLMDESNEFSEYNLDCEYNRNGASCKSLPSFPNGTYPDVIVHKRGNNEFNLLIIEFKTYWNRNIKDDIIKIKEFTDFNGKYKFICGMSIIIGKERKTVKIKKM